MLNFFLPGHVSSHKVSPAKQPQAFTSWNNNRKTVAVSFLSVICKLNFVITELRASQY